MRQFFKPARYNSTRGHPLKLYYPDSRINVRAHFYRAMHFSAKRGIAIACRLSVRLSVRPSVRL